MKLKPVYIIIILFCIFNIFYLFDMFENISNEVNINQDISYFNANLLNNNSFFNVFNNIENNLEDKLLHSRSNINNSNFEDIVIVAIDDLSLEKIGKWPWNRTYFSKVIDTLASGDPAAIGIDVIFAENSSDQQEDKALGESIKRVGNVIIPVYGVLDQYTRNGNIKVNELVEPIDPIMENAKLGHINVIVDDDGIVRQPLFQINNDQEKIESFSSQIYNQYIKSSKKNIKNIETNHNNWNKTYINFIGKAGTFEYLSFYDVLNGDVPPEYFEGRIVLIGPYSLGLQDAYYTSKDKQNAMYGVEIHANIIQNYIDGKFKQRVPGYIDFIILVLFSIVGAGLFKIAKPMKSLLMVIGIICTYLFAAVKLYDRGFIIQLFYPVGLISAIYLFFWIYKYVGEIIEKRRITSIFGRYVAPQIVHEIIKGGEESIRLGGSRREITTLFVDIRGFTTLSEKAKPEEVVEILNEYLDLCAQSIFKNKGTLDKFIGDATMAIFNAPLELEDHAYKAVQAAWNMKVGSLELQQKIQKKFNVIVQFGIGVNTGIAVVGNIGCKTRMDYTAIGDAVNTAARLESTAKAGQIIISKGTYDLIKDKVDVICMGEIKVKGKENGIEVYEVKGLREQK